MQKRLLFRGLLLPVLFAGLYACVDSFTPRLNLDTDLLVVQGILTDQPVPQVVSLSRSRSTADKNTSTPVTGAQVQILVNGTPLSLSETQPGRYELPATFRAKAGTSYQLRFTTASGTRYESTTETMVAVPPIQKVYDQFQQNGPSQTYDGTPIPVSNVYLDYRDPADTQNFYLWRWTLYESQPWCASCKQGKYYITVDKSGNLSGACVADPTLKYGNYYDYTCRTLCWDLFYSQNINVLADVYTNGLPQLGRLIAQIPVYTTDPALVDIEQLSLTAGAYRYYKLFQEQTQNTGTLADTPPAPTVGNVRNIGDASENVVGYFTASAVSINHYWLDRLNVPLGNYRGLFYAQTGRIPNVEAPRGDPNVFGQGVPSALCIPGSSRTDQQPVGWH